jgi:uncharacterized protein YndB with AHSA1/START domain
MGQSFSSVTKVLAPRPVVWRVMSDHVRYAQWTSARDVSMETLGSPDPNGVGAIRVFDSGPVKVREEVVEFDPPTRLVYRLASGLPVRDYRSVMTLEEDGDVTVLTWSSTFAPRIPLTGRLFTRIMRGAVDRFAAGIKTEAEAEASSGGNAG